MIKEASEVATELEIDPRRHGPLGARSHELAVKATDEGRLAGGDRARDRQVEEGRDESSRSTRRPRRETSLEALAKLPPSSCKDGSHTAGNAPGVNDGAGALVLASDEWAEQEGRTPLARDRRVRRRSPTTSPTWRAPRRRPRSRRSRRRQDSPRTIDLWEINEAFASVAINSVRMLGIDEDKVNVNGGAIALGHPIGASGARIVGDAHPRASPPRRRPRLRGDLLGRRPGRRDRPRGEA